MARRPGKRGKTILERGQGVRRVSLWVGVGSVFYARFVLDIYAGGREGGTFIPLPRNLTAPLFNL